MNLAEFVEYVEAHLHRRTDDGAQALEPQLRALGGNQRFLADYLAANLDKVDFQEGNQYAGSAIVLAKGERYVIRAAGWAAAQVSSVGTTGRQPFPKTLSLDPFGIYAGKEPVAHTHGFELLTYGYFGPGYTTACYDCDPEELVTKRIGDPVTLGPRRLARLEYGSVLYYPPFRVAHVQYPPPEYSISLNLIVVPLNHRGFEQYFVSPTMGTLVDVGGSETSLNILNFVSWMKNAETVPLLERIAASHRFASVRERAAQILRKRTSTQPTDRLSAPSSSQPSVDACRTGNSQMAR